MLYNGMKITTNPNLVVLGPPVTRRRTWKERLFSRPWRPWKSTITERPLVPDREVYCSGLDTLVMHPVVAAELRRAISNESKSQ